VALRWPLTVSAHGGCAVKKIAAALAAAVGIACHDQAAAQVVFKGPVQFAGTGCGAGTYALSGEGTDTLSILFSAYDAADPPDYSVSKLKRAACDIAVPVQAPAGCQISVITADWRGYAAGSAELRREYFFAGKPSLVKTSNPEENYTTSDSLRWKTVSVSGEELIFRINSSIRALEPDSYIAVDTTDLHNTLILHVSQENCSQQGLPALPAILNLLL
jgi:hypothetical protein